MAKRTSIEIKKAILETLNDNQYYSYTELERKVNTNWTSIKNHCLELEIFEAIETKENKAKITSKGKKFLEKIKKLF